MDMPGAEAWSAVSGDMKVSKKQASGRSAADNLMPLYLRLHCPAPLQLGMPW